MTIDINMATQQIKKSGKNGVRIIPMEGQSITEGNYQIEIKQEERWIAIVEGVKKAIAEQIISQALNRTICG